jgi:AraC family transcriptional activator of pobA
MLVPRNSASLPTRHLAALPTFHLYGDPPDDHAFDFVHIEQIVVRSSIHDWSIGAHRHCNLSQILLIERGGGEIMFDAAKFVFAESTAIVVPAMAAHAFRFEPNITNGWVVTFTEDANVAFAEHSREPLFRSSALGAQPVVPICEEAEFKHLAALCAELFEEHSSARGAQRLVMRSLLTLIAVNVARLAAIQQAPAEVTWSSANITLRQLRALVDENFRKERSLEFYGDKLSMTRDRLNDHVKRAAGMTASHFIRQRVLVEATRQLIFTARTMSEIAEDLAFSDRSHFARFFRQYTGTPPREFRRTRDH